MTTKTDALKKEQLLSKPRIMNIGFKWSAGPYLGKFLQELRDKGKIWIAQCPGCKRWLLPPRIVCEVCYTELPRYPKGWKTVSPIGKLMFWEKVVYPQMDPDNGKIKPEKYMHGHFELEEGVSLAQYIGPETLDEKTLKQGMKAKMVMKPPRQREGKMSDIKYFKIVEG